MNFGIGTTPLTSTTGLKLNHSSVAHTPVSDVCAVTSSGTAAPALSGRPCRTLGRTQKAPQWTVQVWDVKVCGREHVMVCEGHVRVCVKEFSSVCYLGCDAHMNMCKDVCMCE